MCLLSRTKLPNQILILLNHRCPGLLRVPVSFGGHSLKLCLLVIFASHCSGAGTLSVPQNKPFPEVAHTVTLAWGNFVRSPNLCTFCTLPVPGAKPTEGAVVPIDCLQE